MPRKNRKRNVSAAHTGSVPKYVVSQHTIKRGPNKGKVVIKRSVGKAKIGSRVQVYRGHAEQTSGGLTRNQLERVKVGDSYRIKQVFSHKERKKMKKKMSPAFEKYTKFCKKNRAAAKAYAVKRRMDYPDLTVQQITFKVLGMAYRGDVNIKNPLGKKRRIVMEDDE